MGRVTSLPSVTETHVESNKGGQGGCPSHRRGSPKSPKGGVAQITEGGLLSHTHPGSCSCCSMRWWGCS